MFPIRIFTKEPTFDFAGKRLAGFVCSIFLITASIGMMAYKGLNFGIDFTGGVLMEVRSETPIELAAMRALFADTEYGEVSLQHFGDAQGVLIRIQQRADGDVKEVVKWAKDTLQHNGYDSLDYRKTDFVGPTIGRELIQAGALSLALAIGAIMLYIWFRFEWQYGLGAILALVHDLIATLGFYALTGYDFGLASIAAILTILGYSINDSVVIYDRIRESLRKFKKKHITDIINISVNANLSRTLLTSGTTMVAVAILVIFGGEVLRGFAMAILFGVIIGTYSSVFIAAPILIYFQLRGEEEQEEAVPATGNNHP